MQSSLEPDGRPAARRAQLHGYPLKIAFLFAGEDAWDPVARELVSHDDVAGPWAEACKRSKSKLDRTLVKPQHVQPAITAISVGVTEWLAGLGVRPDMVAGYGLGEVAAWHAAGGISADSAVRAAADRGAEIGKLRIGGGQIAVPATATPSFDVETAAWVGDELILSGPLKALEKERKQWGGRWLHKDGPWNHWELAPAGTILLKRFDKLERRPLSATFVSTRDGKVVEHGDSLPRLLAEQVDRPIQWDRTLRNLYYQLGARHFVAIGFAGRLEALLRPNLPDEAQLHLAHDPATIAAVGEALSG